MAAVLPAIAKVAGPMLRSQGGRMMATGGKGSKTASFGSQLMKVTDGKLLKSMEKANKIADMSLKTISFISRSVGKIVGVLAKHSPALKQQLIVLGKGFSVMIRPIGDIMARFVRPMAVWVMKIAQKWYGMFGTGAGDQDKSDLIEGLERELQDLKAGGADPQLIQAAEERLSNVKKESDGSKSTDGIFDGVFTSLDNLNAKLDETFAETKMGQWTETLSTFFADLWTKILPDQVKETWDALVETGAAFWQVLVDLWKLLEPKLMPVFKTLGIILGGIVWFALKKLEFTFKALTFVFNVISVVLKTLRLGFNFLRNIFAKIGDWLSDKLNPGLQKFYDWIKKIADWASNPAKIGQTVSRGVDTVKGWFGKATGGEIQTSGLYNLHAGERVLTAGETARRGSSNSTNINNHFTINATINNDLDIRELARKLADYNEVELRRRVSYG